MFLAPFLEVIGLNAGEMELIPYGKFRPSEELVEAYYRYVEKYKERFGLKTVEGLSNHIENCLKGRYEPLDGIDEMSKRRIEYMESYVGLLVKTIIDKNEECFGMLPMSTEVEF